MVERVLESLGLRVGPVYITRGKKALDRQIKGFNRAAEYAPWVVVRDFDNEAPCPGRLVQKLLPKPAQNIRFRLAVRSIESWLLADRERMAKYLSVRALEIPAAPDDIPNPKLKLVAIAGTSRSRAVREDLVPNERTNSVGPGYTSRLVEYATLHWRPEVASKVSPSLARCIAAIQSLTSGA